MATPDSQLGTLLLSYLHSRAVSEIIDALHPPDHAKSAKQPARDLYGQEVVRGVAQLGLARLLWEQEVGSSNLPAPTNLTRGLEKIRLRGVTDEHQSGLNRAFRFLSLRLCFVTLLILAGVAQW